MVHVPLLFLSEWREFSSASCLAGKKNLMTARVSMLLKSRASPDMLPFSLCNKKRLAIRHINDPLSNDTIDSVLRHQEVGRAKDLSAPPRKLIFNAVSLNDYKITCSQFWFTCRDNGVWRGLRLACSLVWHTCAKKLRVEQGSVSMPNVPSRLKVLE